MFPIYDFALSIYEAKKIPRPLYVVVFVKCKMKFARRRVHFHYANIKSSSRGSRVPENRVVTQPLYLLTTVVAKVSRYIFWTLRIVHLVWGDKVAPVERVKVFLFGRCIFHFQKLHDDDVIVAVFGVTRRPAEIEFLSFVSGPSRGSFRKRPHIFFRGLLFPNDELYYVGLNFRVRTSRFRLPPRDFFFPSFDCPPTFSLYVTWSRRKFVFMKKIL